MRRVLRVVLTGLVAMVLLPGSVFAQGFGGKRGGLGQ